MKLSKCVPSYFLTQLSIASSFIVKVGVKELLNKQVGCPRCGGKHYYRSGQDKGSQRFKCKECLKAFTEYTGTWQERLHKKALVEEYILMMSEQKSLDKISAALHINKKTTFDWRHKRLDTFNQD